MRTGASVVALFTLITLFTACGFDGEDRDYRYQITVMVAGTYDTVSLVVQGVDPPVFVETSVGSGIFVLPERETQLVADPFVLELSVTRAVDSDSFTLTVIQTELSVTPKSVQTLYSNGLSSTSGNATLELRTIVTFPR